jgi:hypothetical protein
LNQQLARQRRAFVIEGGHYAILVSENASASAVNNFAQKLDFAIYFSDPPVPGNEMGWIELVNFAPEPDLAFRCDS